MKYEEMPYSRIDFAEETRYLKELMKRFQAAKSAEEQFAVHQEYYKMARHIQTEMTLASTRNSLDTSDAFYDQEKDYYDREYPAYSNLAVEYAKLLLKSPFRKELEEIIGHPAFRNMELAEKSTSEAIIPLKQEENALVSRYEKMMASAAIEWEGQIYNISQMTPFQRSKDLNHMEGEKSLSVAVGGDVYFALQTDMKAASKYLDYVQLMTYDLQGGFQKVTGHHAALYHSEGNLLDVCVDKAVKAFHEAGVPMEKLILGVPFYSRQWNGVKGEGCRHGLGMEADSVGGYGGDYAELKADWIGKNGFVRYWDEVAKVPYLFDGKTFVSYEDEESLGGKIEYLKEMGMGGIMFWEYKCDPSGELLGYIREQL